jgi:poly(beta-D-mannuronate) lyase
MLRVIACILFAGTVSAKASTNCPPTQQPLRDVVSVNIYGDGALRSSINKERLAQRERLMRSANDFLHHTASLADRFVENDDNDAARCALDRLLHWAADGAFLGVVSSEAASKELIWNSAGLSLSYLRVKRAASQLERTRIEAWLATLAFRVIDKYRRSARRDNVFCWVGLVAAAGAAATEKQEFWELAAEMHEAALRQVDARGVLPAELDRGPRALAYLNFALVPLLVTYELRARGRIGTSEAGREALGRLVEFTFKSMHDPLHLSRLAGAPPDDPGRRYFEEWSYLASYVFPTIVLRPPAKVAPFERWLGGRLSYFVS